MESPASTPPEPSVAEPDTPELPAKPELSSAAEADPVQSMVGSLSTSALLATAGGFLDGFAYVGHGHVFANAMTGNVVLLGIGAISVDGQQSFRHLPPILMFLLGIWAAKVLHTDAARRRWPNPYIGVLGIEMSILLLLACLPQRTPDFWITSSIAFAASMQVQTFRSVGSYSYNSTFVSGNLRMLSSGLFDWLFGHKEKDGRNGSRIFASICGVFLLGATAGGFAVTKVGNRALFIELAMLLVVMVRLLLASASAL